MSIEQLKNKLTDQEKFLKNFEKMIKAKPILALSIFNLLFDLPKNNQNNNSDFREIAEQLFEQNKSELINNIIRVLNQTGFEFAQFLLDYLNDSLHDNLNNNDYYSVTFPNRREEQKAIAYILMHSSGKVLGTRQHELAGKVIKELSNLGIQFEVERMINCKITFPNEKMKKKALFYLSGRKDIQSLGNDNYRMSEEALRFFRSLEIKFEMKELA